MLYHLPSLFFIWAQATLYPTNLELLRKAVDEALKGFSKIQGVEQVWLSPESPSRGDWLVAEGLIRTLTDLGVEVFSASQPGVSWELRYRVTELGLVHQHLRRNWPWSQALVRRLARAGFVVTILKDRQFLERYSLWGGSADTVPAAQLPWLTSEEIPVQVIPAPGIGIWEPLAVALLVGVLILAFYLPPTF